MKGEKKMAVRCGIDLGTTYSAISFYDEANKRVETLDLETADGGRILRSVVYYPGEDEDSIVGDTAWNTARQYPDRVISGIKRTMGTSFKTAPIDGKEYTPSEVSSEILKVLAADGQLFLAEPVKDVVITVPAYFGDNERAATLEAGKKAELNVLALLSEPQAAALAYAVEKVADIRNKHLLVYDLGGGTFDVTLIYVTTNNDDDTDGPKIHIDTLAKDGDRELGGMDWDRALAELVAEKVLQEFNIDVREDPKSEAVLLDSCEKAKRHLSRTSQVDVVADLQSHQVNVTVSEFEDRTADLIYQTQARLENVLDKAEKEHGVTKDQIEVMLAGGSSKMPSVRRMIEGVMGKAPLQYGNPELLVTIGATYWAKLLEGIDDIGKPVGVEVKRPDGAGGYVPANSVVIPDEAPYKKDFKRTFATTADDMTEIPIVLYEGDSENLDQCTKLMTFTITGLPAGRPAGKQIEVMIGYDENGIIRGTAQDLETSQAVDILIDRSPGAVPGISDI